MAATVTVNSTPNIIVSQKGTGILANQTLTFTETLQTIFQTSGLLADQCDLLYAATLTLVASTPQTIDLTALADLFGGVVNFARVRFLAMRNNSVTDGANVLIGDSVTNEWDAFLSAAATLKVPPCSALNHGYFILTAPNTTGFVVDSTHKTLKIDPGSNAMTLDIIIAGCHA